MQSTTINRQHTTFPVQMKKKMKFYKLIYSIDVWCVNDIYTLILIANDLHWNVFAVYGWEQNS